jgi:TonB-linked SusC/RagA family outer membrane protein
MKKHQTLQCLIFAIMRFTGLQILIMVVISGVATATSFNTYGQTVLDEVISINAAGKKIKDVLLEIEKSVNIKFTYNPQTIAADQKVSVNYQNRKLSDILETLFHPLNVDYRLAGDYIILKKHDGQSNATRTTSAFDMPGAISGTVADEEGSPLPGVNVSIKGTLIGAATDADGKYAVSITDKNSILVFSFIGYKTQEITVGEQTTIDVKMVSDIESLSEVVVVGYGTQKEYTSAGSITTVNVQKQLQYGTTRSLSNNLAGQVAGVIAVQRSGEPGYDNSNFWIRGITTFQGAREPLVLIDGVERSLNNIDPAEIESFSVLKDASASAVYGVRGANGVVLINTKRGAVGKPTITFRYEQGFTQPVKLPEFLGADEYLDVLNSISDEAGTPRLYSEERIANIRNKVDPELYPDVDWLDAITKDHASNSRYNLTASGGSNFLRYSIVGSYYTEQGIIARDPRYDWDSSLKLQRYNIRSNVDLDVTRTTLVSVSIGGFLQDESRSPQSMDDLFSKAFETPPHVHPVQYSSGEIPVVPERTNPWAMATQTGYRRSSGSKLESLFSVEQNLDAVVPGLTGRFKFSFDRFSSTWVNRSKSPDYYNPATGRNEDGSLNLSIYRYGQEFLGYEKGSDFGDKSIYLEGSFTYSHNIGNHYLDGLLLYNQRSYDNGDKLPYRFQGLAARLSYSYNRKYIVEANFGYNGSENFAKGHRYGFFPSIALGWLVTEEEFMSSLKTTFSKLKLRGSIGQVGNDRLGIRYPYISTISDTDGYRWGINNDYFRAGKREGFYGVPNLTWETVTKANAGIELGLWNSSILFQADFFKEQRKDIFMQRQNIPASAGFIERPYANFGKVKNHGVDLSLSVNKQVTQDFYISSQATFTFARNEIVEQDEAPGIKGTIRSTTGKPISQNMGYVAERLFNNEDFADIENGVLISSLPEQKLGKVRPGDIKYKDLSGDGVVDALDQTSIGGTVDPQIVYGFGVNMKYKNIDFGFFCQGNGRTDRIIGGSFFIPGSGNGALGNIYSNVSDRWTVDNPRQDVFWPRLASNNDFIDNNKLPSTWWLRDMSMVRLKHVEIGYSLPSRIAQKGHLKNARIFVTGNNLMTFSSFKLWDPELNTSNGFRYPIMKSVSIGVNLEF